MIASEILHFLKEFHQCDIADVSVTGGGSINNCFSYLAKGEKFFLKYNDSRQFPDIIHFDKEGLSAIAATNTIATPSVVACENVGNYEVLVLPFIEQERPGKLFWEQFGQNLAALHFKEAPFYGWQHDNYIGSLHQSNRQQKQYLPFLVQERLQKQIALANRNNSLSEKDNAAFEQLFKQLPDIIPEAQASLVHGDLWSGNFVVGKGQIPYLIDPSIHYSFRETDLAFTYLFGGFHQKFYEAYEESFPLSPGFQERIGIYNLYPLLVHLNLFGNSYLHSIRDVLKKIS
ncbi:ketosamine-3-kinase [Marivirga lumbricoides]|uniref:Ketosamine-3-kinase n=1 Tax=Marivirga lumbricoides TaxID=1046115 RepID=A0A2T4DPQ9_9BACT|nr:ketosamine-3-kinase [Marivirga lumbricoides]